MLWIENKIYNVGDIVQYNEKSYKTLQKHISILSWNPVVAITLWEIVGNVPPNSNDDLINKINKIEINTNINGITCNITIDDQIYQFGGSLI